VKYLGRLACGLVTVPCELFRRDCEAFEGVFALKQSFSCLFSARSSHVTTLEYSTVQFAAWLLLVLVLYDACHLMVLGNLRLLEVVELKEK